MNASDKAAVNAAKNGKGKSNSASNSTSASNAETCKNSLSELTVSAQRKFADSFKNQVVGGGISLAFAEMADGNYGEYSESVLNSVTQFIDCLEQDVISLQAEESPKSLPASNSYQTACVESVGS